MVETPPKKTPEQFVLELSDCEKYWVTGHGKGGQNRNRKKKTLYLRWNIPERKRKHETDYFLESKGGETRSAEQNLKSALTSLRRKVNKYLAVPKRRIETKPSASSVRKVHEEKKKTSEKKSLRKHIKK